MDNSGEKCTYIWKTFKEHKKYTDGNCNLDGGRVVNCFILSVIANILIMTMSSFYDTNTIKLHRYLKCFSGRVL